MSASYPDRYPKSSSASPADVESTCSKYGLDKAEFEELHKGSVAAKATAYCPYSQFRVGATILAAGGVYISGANVENAAYPVGTCAERVAFGKAVTEGHKKFKAVAVATDIAPPASPCGMCRQLLVLLYPVAHRRDICHVLICGTNLGSIREFCDLSTPILMFDKNGDYLVQKLEELLPLSFGPEALPPPGRPGVSA
ncbi:cytidine deaminase-like protein [Apiospora kogelbergensis]|uniref:cytidine deaminase-like protein n=1 Tax=Apiospora kogelbergensis TaxID=1337665 RepID=UPI0031318519